MSVYSRSILMGGLAGGAAEVMVVALYALLAGTGGWLVAESVSQATFGTLFSGQDAVVVGLTVHFALSFLIAAAFVPLVPYVMHRYGRRGVLLAAAALLGCIWMLNFRVVLPRIAPEFVALVPLWLSLLSKLSFGAAMGWAIVSSSRFSGSRPRTPA